MAAAKKIVRVIKEYNDLKLGVLKKVGEKLEVTATRAKELVAAGVGVEEK